MYNVDFFNESLPCQRFRVKKKHQKFRSNETNAALHIFFEYIRLFLSIENV